MRRGNCDRSRRSRPYRRFSNNSSSKLGNNHFNSNKDDLRNNSPHIPSNIVTSSRRCYGIEDMEKCKYREEQLLYHEDFSKLLNDMLQETFSENISEKLLEKEEQMTECLNDAKSHSTALSTSIIKVIIKGSTESKLEKAFRNLLHMVLSTSFAQKTIDNLVSAYLPMNPDVNMFNLLVSFLKLPFEIFPGLAYDLYYFRVENLSALLEIPYFKTNVTNEASLYFEELRLLVASSCPYTEKKGVILKDNIKGPPDDYRSRTIFPTSADLLETEGKDVFLRKNKSEGAYESVDDYLDVQFRLMHEDFIQPLREGLKDYRTQGDKKSFNIRVYNKVRLLDSAPNRRLGIVQYIQLDNSRLRKIKWSQSKRLIYGSLLCFSCDDFETLLFATVANRDDKDIKKGILAVKFVDRIPFNDKEYTMLETMNMFESYRHVLEKLQNTNEKNLCMKEYLVFAEKDIKLPRYVRAGKGYYINGDVIRPGDAYATWPSPARLKMNVSQFEAFKSALTKEITIIQGPPGTGKTYLGLKICSCLVQNVQDDVFGPILVVCYTNHALDQFLEGISRFTDNIVRIGGQCKSEKIQKFSLQSWKEKESNKVYKRKKWMIHEQLNDLEEVLNIQSYAFKSIISIAGLRHFISWDHYEYLDKLGINNWLSGKSLSDVRLGGEDLIEWEAEELIYEEIQENLEAIVRTALSTASYQDEDEGDDNKDNDVNYVRNERMLDVDFEEVENLNFRFMQTLKLQNEFKRSTRKDAITKRLIKNSLIQTVKMSEEEVEEVGSLDELSFENRWRLYQHWRFHYINFLKKRSETTEREYETLSKRLSDIQFEEDEYIMEKKSIIGMTTTGAARYSRVLERIGCKIIIVEEAAEVLESHIIGSLNSGCEHLILMGDHKQLRPSPAVYELALKYKLDLSLFERLINNKLHYNTLSVQHRMRPEIADIVRFIYDDLQDAPNVSMYPNVPSVSRNIFFFNHWEREDLNKDSKSYSNRFEADLIVKFCHHLIQNGVLNTEITILTLYSGQMFLIGSLMDKKLYSGVRVCVVDNYQGEENNIILLSLVRSNEEEKIGFVGIDNRICVSLSRAKHGLYVFGNFDLLSHKSTLWRTICQFLSNKGCLGKTMNMLCQNHPAKSLIISAPEDFNKYPDGGCEELCNTTLKCGHICTRYCHFLDRDHELFECMFPCVGLCPLGHKCKLICFQDCKNCDMKVQKVIPGCGHLQLMSCRKDPVAIDCLNTCEKVLVCAHRCTRLCGEKCGQCLTMIEKRFTDCAHSGEYSCYDEAPTCNHPCEAKLGCGHACTGTCTTCYSGRLHVKCMDHCGAELVCGHLCKAGCSDPCYPCSERCDKGCVHSECTKECGNECIVCEEPCPWKCDHLQCHMLCNDACDRGVCNEGCQNRLACSGCRNMFQCYGICGERCRTMCPSCDPSVDENMRYITLWTCEHIFEVSMLDRYMFSASDDGEVVRKRCPLCRTMISARSCFRYLSVVRMISSRMSVVQRRINQEVTLLQYHLYEKVLTDKKALIFTLFHEYGVTNYFSLDDDTDYLHTLYFRNKHLHKHILVYKYKTSLDLLFQLLKLLYKSLYLPKKVEDSNMRQSVANAIRWLDPNKRKFDKFEIDQFVAEFDRIGLLMKGARSKSSLSTFLTRFNTAASLTETVPPYKCAFDNSTERSFYQKGVQRCQVGKGDLDVSSSR